MTTCSHVNESPNLMKKLLICMGKKKQAIFMHREMSMFFFFSYIHVLVCKSSSSASTKSMVNSTTKKTSLYFGLYLRAIYPPTLINFDESTPEPVSQATLPYWMI